MLDITKQDRFQIIVSDRQPAKLGAGGTATAEDSCVYYYAEKTGPELVSLQLTTPHFLPTGDKKSVPIAEFLRRYRPEPLLYFNKALPAMEALQHTLSKAESHLKNNRLDKAEATFKEALSLDKDNIKAVFGLGITYVSGGNTENAGEIFDKIMSLELAFSPEYTNMFNEFGIKMRKVGMLDKALAYFRKALEFNAQDENLYFNLARVYYERKDDAKVLGCLDKALELAPGFLEAQKMKRFIAR